jgi:hypothetical protein
MSTEQKSKKPSHHVFVVDGEGDNAFWTKVGAAWSHDDGKGFSVSLSCMPVNGRLVIREPKAGEGSGQ